MAVAFEAGVLRYPLGDGTRTSAWVALPDGLAAGVVLSWHGTQLPGIGTPATRAAYLNQPPARLATEVTQCGWLWVEPHLRGLGESQGTAHQRWHMLAAVADEGEAVLRALLAAGEEHGWWDGGQLPMYSIGASQGGTNTVGFHFWWQRCRDRLLRERFELRRSLACSGTLSAVVIEQAMFTKYSKYSEAPLVLESVDRPLLPVSKKMQHILLAHLLYTFQTATGFRPEIEYADGFAPDKAAEGDDFGFMAVIINDILQDEQKLAAPESISGFETPSFLTAQSWSLLCDKSSPIRRDVLEFVGREMCSVARFGSDRELERNYISLDLYHSRNDLNVLWAHSAAMAAAGPGTNVRLVDCSDGAETISGLFDRHHAPYDRAKTELFKLIDEDNAKLLIDAALCDDYRDVL